MLESMASDKHPVCLLQEMLQKRNCPGPLYTALGQQGPDRLHHTSVSFRLDDRQHIRTFHGFGTSKKMSKANAAQKALEYINETRPKLVQPPPSKMQRLAAKKRRSSSWSERDPFPGKVKAGKMPYVIPAHRKIASHDQTSHPHKVQPSTSPPHSSGHKTTEQQFHRQKSMTPSSRSHGKQPSIPPSSHPSIPSSSPPHLRKQPSTPPSSQPSQPSTPPSCQPQQYSHSHGMQPSTPPSSPPSTSDHLIDENTQYPHSYNMWPSMTPPSSPPSQALFLPLNFGLTIPALLLGRPAAASLEPGQGQTSPSQLRLPLDLGPVPSFVIRPTIAVFPSPPLTPFPHYKHSGQ